MVFWPAPLFVLFRIFDILKLPPANRIQNLKGGSGILLDDIVAGASLGRPQTLAALEITDRGGRLLGLGGLGLGRFDEVCHLFDTGTRTEKNVAVTPRVVHPGDGWPEF